MIGGVGVPELIFIFLIFVLLFGAKKLPELAKGLGQAVKFFKKEMREIQQDIDVNETTRASIPADTGKDTSNDFDPEAPKRDWRPKQEEDSHAEKV
ncbi:MAG: twin-arginine translocase TatA/TatE family subunit [Candidatus Omnitrophica bacterium]|nr:twin-arginine translocase TatA/TatE family subunit [Candidatus Omnitrophota bacterium]